MLEGNLYNISDVARALGKEKNRKLIRALIRAKGIQHRTVGRDTILDQEGFDRLKVAVAEWDNRPRLNRMAASA